MKCFSNSHIVNRLSIALVLAICTLITFLPFFNVGFTCADDFEYYLAVLKGNILGNTQYLAYLAGRFYFLITMPLYYFPYVFGSFAAIKVVQYTMLFITYVLFSRLASRVTKSDAVGIATYIILLLSTQITANHHIPIQAYPFFFSLSFSIMTLSLLSFVRYVEQGKTKWIIISAVLFGVASLFYETYLLFLLLFCAYIFFRSAKNRGIVASLHCCQFWKEILPYVAVGIGYVTAYFMFRHFHPSVYSGSQFATNFSLSHFFIIMNNCTFTLLPMSPMAHGEERTMYMSVMSGSTNFVYMLTHAPWYVYIHALLLAGVSFFVLRKMPKSLSWKAIIIIIGISFFAAFFAHTLLGVSDKYNRGWYSWMHGYVTTFFSLFGLSLVIAMIVYALLKKCNQKYQTIVSAAISVLVCVVAIVVGNANHGLSKYWQLRQMTFDEIEMAVKDGTFAFDEEKIYSKDLKLGVKPSSVADFINIHLQGKDSVSALESAKQVLQFSGDVCYLGCGVQSKVENHLLVKAFLNKQSLVDSLANPFELATSNNVQLLCTASSSAYNVSFEADSSFEYAVVNGVDTIRQCTFNVQNLRNNSQTATIRIEGNGILIQSLRYNSAINSRTQTITIK